MNGPATNLDVVRVFCDAAGGGGNQLGVFLDGRSVPEPRRQPIATELGFAETVFVDDPGRGEIRIFTPATELPLAGHPLVGTAWLLRERGITPAVLRPPAGEVRVRFAGELTHVSADPDWAPPFEFEQLGSPADVDRIEGPVTGRGMIGVWAWIDRDRGLIRERVFVPEAGIDEDEATGSAAMRLCAQLGQPIEIRQGRGSVIWATPLAGDLVEIGGRVSYEESRTVAIGASD